MSSDQPQDAPQPQDARRSEHVEIVEQAMEAEPAPPPVSRRARLRRAVTARRPTRALLRPAALVAAGLIAGILLTLGVGALGRDGGDRGPGPGVADGRGGWDRGDGPRDRERDRGRDGADGSTDSDEDDDTTTPESTSPETTTPGTTSPTTEPTPSGTA